ncbi:uncharacterized protein [Oscarella lobularis]
MEVLSRWTESAHLGEMSLRARDNRMAEMTALLREHTERRRNEYEAVKRDLEWRRFFAVRGTESVAVGSDENKYWNEKRILKWIDSGGETAAELFPLPPPQQSSPSLGKKPLTKPVLCRKSPSATRLSRQSSSSIKGSTAEVVKLHLVEKSDWFVTKINRRASTS